MSTPKSATRHESALVTLELMPDEDEACSFTVAAEALQPFVELALLIHNDAEELRRTRGEAAPITNREMAYSAMAKEALRNAGILTLLRNINAASDERGGHRYTDIEG